MAILSDRNSEYYCIVDDVSEQGFRLGQIQHDFDEKDGEYRARVLAPFDDIALTAKPRWTTTTSRGMHKTIGFRIENPPDEWRGFIGKLQKKTGEYNYLLSEDETGGATQ
ncbi:MAG: hypothetical protein Kow0089_07220 [Desulfobulbaceae bacterium]